ncbi:MAG: hypothetical protein QXY49_02190 [Thermofilaceae archaeon]
MTGPGEGKIPLKSRVFLVSGRSRVELYCSVYLHVKGYSMARVTHVDVEADQLNELLLPGDSAYAIVYTTGEELRIKFQEGRSLRSTSKQVSEVSIKCMELVSVLAPVRSIAYIGGKEGGIFIGFKREFVRKLEELAVKLGVMPK